MTSHNNLHALLYQTSSAEYIALCVQTYLLARHALIERLNEGTSQNPAVILDLDETILDNSAYQKWQIENGYNFNESTSWRAWSSLGLASAVPGALEFVRFAESKKVKPIFVTSRENLTRHGTAQNLYNLGLIDADELKNELAYDVEHPDPAHAHRTRLFMKRMPPAPQFASATHPTFDLLHKFHQRVFIERYRHFEILLSVGDNLGDYAEYYGRVLDASGNPVDKTHPTPDSRKSSAWQDIRLFGREFILIPNASYGGWQIAHERNGSGTGDEMADTGSQVRGKLHEPQTPFDYDNVKQENPKGTKLDTIPGTFTYPPPA